MHSRLAPLAMLVTACALRSQPKAAPATTSTPPLPQQDTPTNGDPVVPTRDLLHYDGTLYERSAVVGEVRSGPTVRYYRGPNPTTKDRRILERGNYCAGVPCGVWQAWDPQGRRLAPRDYGERGEPLIPLEALGLATSRAPRDKYARDSWLEALHHTEGSQALRRRWAEYEPQLRGAARTVLQASKRRGHRLFGPLGGVAQAGATAELNRIRAALTSEALAALGQPSTDEQRAANTEMVIDGLNTLTDDRDLLALVKRLVEIPDLLEENRRYWFVQLTAAHFKFARTDAILTEDVFAYLVAVLSASTTGDASRTVATHFAMQLAPTFAQHTTQPEHVDALMVGMLAVLDGQPIHTAPIHAARGGMYATAGEHEKAAEAYRTAVEQWTPLGYDHRIARVLPSLAASLDALGESEQAAAVAAGAHARPHHACIDARCLAPRPVFK